MVETQQVQKRSKRDGKILTEELYKKDLEPGNCKGVVSHSEPDILECEVKCGLGSAAVNKASGWDGIPVELLKILKK